MLENTGPSSLFAGGIVLGFLCSRAFCIYPGVLSAYRSGVSSWDPFSFCDCLEIASMEDLYIRCLRVSHFPYSARSDRRVCRVITAPCIDYDLKTCPDSLLSMECACLDDLYSFLRFL
jgi:hypothetical protein